MLAIFQAAGWPIWPLLIASIVALALIVERLMYLRRSRIIPKTLLDEVVRVYRSGNITAEIIDKLEKSTVSVKKYQQYRDLFPLCLMTGCGLLVAQILLSQTIWKKLP